MEGGQHKVQIPEIEKMPLDNSTEQNGPETWSSRKKLFHSIVPCLFAFLITFGTSVVEPALLGIMNEFSVSRTAAISSVTLYTFGLAIGPLFLAPIAEIYGRRWIYILSSSCLLAFTAGAAVAPNITTFLICRFLGGLIGSVGIAIGAGTIVDVWPTGQGRATASLFFVLGPFLAPSLAPVAGAYAMSARNNDWRWTEWIVLCIGFPILGLICFLRDTSAPRWLQQQSWRTDERPAVTKQLRRAVVIPFKLLYTDPIVVALTVHTSFGYAVIFSFFSSMFYVLNSVYQLDARRSSLCLLSLVIGYMCAILMCILCEKRIYPTTATAISNNSVPEKKLYAGIVGGLLMLIGETWYTLATFKGGSWAILVAAGIPLGWGVFALFLSAIAYMIEIYPADIVSSVIAANGAVRYTLGATFPLFTIHMYENLGNTWASAIFAFLSLFLLPVPLILCWYGPKLRKRSGRYNPS